MVKGLCLRGGVWGQEEKLSGFQLWLKLFMGRTVIQYQQHTMLFSLHSSIKLRQPGLEKFRGHPYSTGMVFTPLKDLGCAKRPMAKTGIFCEPSMLVHNRNVTRSLVFLPPERLSDLKAKVLSGSKRRNKPLFITVKHVFLAVASQTWLHNIFDPLVSTGSSTTLRSPLIHLKTIECRRLNLDSHPSLHFQ